jgi:hypothetical protein
MADKETEMKRNRNIGAIFALLIGLSAQICTAHAAGETFPSPEEASRALYQAVRDDNEQALTSILGAGNEFVSGDDPVQERREREHFARKYDQMHRLVRASGGSTILYVGGENWPFPFPLVQESGAWHFDAKVGMEEVLARRIGENELAAAAACQALISRNDDDRPAPLYGYYFRRIPGQQTVVAYPAKYRETGVMTFLAGPDTLVFEKDLGPDTAEAAKTIEQPDSLSTWHRVE